MNYKMDENFNFHKYEKYLSPFGQKVMSNLYKFKTENNARRISGNSNYTQRRRPENKGVITFEDSNNAIINDKTHLQFDDDFNSEEIHSKPSVSNDLMITVNNQQREKIVNILDAGRNRKADDRIFQLINKQSIILENSKLDDFSEENQNLISWDNIFDNDLFDDLESPKTNSNKNDEKNSNKDPDVFLNVVCENVSEKMETDIVISNIEYNFKVKPKGNKRKTVETTSKISKINKKNKTDDVKSYRKENYTKTVKKWLNNVNADDVIDHENEICQNTHSPEITLQKVLEKHESVSKPKRGKNTVQAQLANKDGIMKFAKPKLTKSENTNFENMNKESNIELVEDRVAAVVDKVKEKKVKSKFVAPIKTPLPIKDVVYSVNILNDVNIKEFTDILSTDGDEVAMVLVYSNGFCQLNNHYTNDKCVPEGVMFLKYESYYYFNIVQENFTELLSKLVQNVLICFDAKAILTYLMSQTDVSCCKLNIFDLKIGGSLMNPDEPPEYFSELHKLLSYSPDFTIATDCQLQKTAWYMSLMIECAVKLRNYLMDKELWTVFVDLEMRVLPVIAGMEYRGIQVDLEKLKSMENTLVTRMKKVEKECYKAAGKNFQINSALQVRNILYEELNLDTKCNIKIRETICKAKSTSEAMLRSLSSVHPLPNLILEYRHLHKAHATFVAGIVNQVRDGIVKPTWDQMAAVTGRIACNNPNLQAIPKAPFSLTLHSDDGQTDVILKFRSAFVPRAGFALLAADFKHVECRVFAHAAADAALARALAGADLFAVLAAQWLNKREEAVSSEERERTKRIVYASLYGAGARTLADILQIDYEQALSVLASFNRTFPSLKSFGRGVVERCAAQGGLLRSAAGRARAFPDVGSGAPARRAHAERQAVNFVVQGTAADLCKCAMVLTTDAMQTCEPPIEAHLLLQLHDELVWEVRVHALERAAGIIREAMEGCGARCGLPVGLPVAVARGRDWGTMEPLA